MKKYFIVIILIFSFYKISWSYDIDEKINKEINNVIKKYENMSCLNILIEMNKMVVEMRKKYNEYDGYEFIFVLNQYFIKNKQDKKNRLVNLKPFLDFFERKNNNLIVEKILFEWLEDTFRETREIELNKQKYIEEFINYNLVKMFDSKNYAIKNNILEGIRGILYLGIKNKKNPNFNFYKEKFSILFKKNIESILNILNIKSSDRFKENFVFNNIRLIKELNKLNIINKKKTIIVLKYIIENKNFSIKLRVYSMNLLLKEFNNLKNREYVKNLELFKILKNEEIPGYRIYSYPAFQNLK